MKLNQLFSYHNYKLLFSFKAEALHRAQKYQGSKVSVLHHEQKEDSSHGNYYTSQD
jgi:hypothetical protein